MQDEFHQCWNCRWCIFLNECHTCLLAREKIHNPFQKNYCDFWRGYHDDLYDNDAMDRQIEADDHIVPTTE